MKKAEPPASAPEREWLPRTPYLSTPEAGRCQVCGMEDAKRFKIGVGTAWWNNNPVHDACEQWITTNPDGSEHEQPRSLGPEKRGGYSGGMPRSAVGPPAKIPSGSVRAAVTPLPADESVMARFPHITAEEIQAAKMAQTGGHPILVTRAEAGAKNLLFYRLPEVPRYLGLGTETLHVAGGGPVPGGFTLVFLREGLAQDHPAGALAAPYSEAPHPQQCECPACDIARLDQAAATMFGIPPPQLG